MIVLANLLLQLVVGNNTARVLNVEPGYITLFSMMHSHRTRIITYNVARKCSTRFKCNPCTCFPIEQSFHTKFL